MNEDLHDDLADISWFNLIIRDNVAVGVYSDLSVGRLGGQLGMSHEVRQSGKKRFSSCLTALESLLKEVIGELILALCMS